MTDITEQNLLDILPHIKEIAVQAGESTIEIFQRGLNVEHKEDDSPVTEADRFSERIILTGLKEVGLGLPVIAEESVAAGVIPDISDEALFWLVDPLDGTKEFITGSGEYTINIALVRRSGPVLGVVYTPVTKELYAGMGPGTATFKKGDEEERTIKVRPLPENGITVTGSRRHGDTGKIDDFLEGYQIAEMVSAGSSLKFCRLAKGAADVYPRFGPTFEWDIAAGDAVLRAAGGATYKPNGEKMTYGKERFWNAEFVAASTEEFFK